MYQGRSLTTCICKAKNRKEDDIWFLSTGFVCDISIDIFTSESAVEQVTTIVENNNKNISLGLHLIYNSPIRNIIPFESLNVKKSNTLRDAILNIFSDIIKQQPVIRDSILKQMEILLKSDTTNREKLLVINFLRGLDTFKYGKDKNKRFETRCIALLTAIVTFLDDKLTDDTIVEFNNTDDIVISVLIEKTKERINKINLISPRLLIQTSLDTKIDPFPDCSK